MGEAGLEASRRAVVREQESRMAEMHVQQYKKRRLFF
jgi:hypothetical protein